MNIKQKVVSMTAITFLPFIMFMFLMSAVVAIIAPGGTVQALTKKEWRECQDEYQGLTLANGASQSDKRKWEKFTASKCYDDQGGNCGTLSKGTGSFTYKEADCPISDKYIKQDENGGGTPSGGSTGTGENPEALNKGATGTCGGVGTSIIKCDQDNSGDIESNAIWGLLLIAINILTAGIGLVAVGGIIYAAILYTTAQDKAAQVTKAKEVIFNVILGLVLFALMYAFLQFLIPGGVFQ